jgi:heat shock protein HtpX
MACALLLSVCGYIALVWVIASLVPGPGAWIAGGMLAVLLLVLVHEADRVLYLATDARAASKQDLPRVWEHVARLAQQADIPQPAIAVLPSEEPNAFTAGRTNRSVLVVTEGLLDKLDDDALQAVLAHEIAHLKNGDTAVLTAASFPAILGLLTLGGARRAQRDQHWLLGYHLGPAIAAVIALPVAVASLPGAVVLARYREYAADRGAAALTGEPAVLASALDTVSERNSATSGSDLRTVASLAAFGIVPASLTWLPAGVFHPPTPERIRRLQALIDRER